MKHKVWKPASSLLPSPCRVCPSLKLGFSILWFSVASSAEQVHETLAVPWGNLLLSASPQLQVCSLLPASWCTLRPPPSPHLMLPSWRGSQQSLLPACIRISNDLFRMLVWSWCIKGKLQAFSVTHWSHWWFFFLEKEADWQFCYSVVNNDVNC